eukprot:TRINITY_DN6982_c0_g2_i2.p1 TRINITY_DN6982_c0_g2~~TRINITY_DN6982_c0_g2_i2.p1  ORF type:complete len:178 (+),score=44.81 TRINITY_DN6982_c0_g2_i2:347-880(+)
MQFLENEKTSLENYREIYGKDGMKIWVKAGSCFNETVPLVKVRYTLHGEIDLTEFGTVLREERTMWDNSFVEYNVTEKVNSEVTVIYYVVKPPIFLMKARDFVEKTIRLEENGILYEYYSSIPNEVFGPKDKYQRGETIFGGNILVKEGEEYGFYTFSQVNVGLSCNLGWTRSNGFD